MTSCVELSGCSSQRDFELITVVLLMGANCLCPAQEPNCPTTRLQASEVLVIIVFVKSRGRGNSQARAGWKAWWFGLEVWCATGLSKEEHRAD